MTQEILWIPFGIFSKLITSIESNVPHTIITYKHCFPWVTHNLRKLINKKNKAYNNRKKHPGKFKKFKNAVQKELRAAYWNYIEKIICDLPIYEPGQFDSSRAKPKNLFNYIKSTHSDNSEVTPLRKESKLITETEEKANILNQQFQSVLTNETDLHIPDKSPSPHPHLYTSVKQGSINC
jgi:hypothetical protein